MTDSGSDGVLEAGDLDVVRPIVTLGLLGFAASVLVLGAALLIARAIYLNSVPASALPPGAVAAAFHILVRFIETAVRTLLVAVLLLIVLGLIELTGQPPPPQPGPAPHAPGG